MQSQSEGLAHQINARKIELIYFQAPISCIGNLVAISIILTFYWNLVAHALLLTWGAIAAMLMLQRWSLTVAFRKRNRYADISTWYDRYNRNVALNGAAWGILFLLISGYTSASELFVLVTVLGALITSTGVAYHGYLKMYLNFAAPAFLPAALLLISRSTSAEMALGAAAICWLVLMLSFAQQINRSLNNSSAYEFSNIALLAELSTQREQSEKLQEEIELKQQIINNLLLSKPLGSRVTNMHPAFNR